VDGAGRGNQSCGIKYSQGRKTNRVSSLLFKIHGGKMIITFTEEGTAQTIYNEKIDLNELGKVTHTRASHVEPDENGEWVADLSLVGGPKLGPFKRRSEAITREIEWLETNYFQVN
jgi:hypothetical protein